MVSPAPRALRKERATSGRCHGAGETKQPLLGAGEGAQRPVNPSEAPAKCCCSPQSPVRGVYSCPGTKRRLAEHGQVRLIPKSQPSLMEEMPRS